MNAESKYLKYLPAYFKDDGTESKPSFAGRFLLAFEKTMSGIADDPTESSESPDPLGIEKILDDMSNYFDPLRAPAPFLDYLASWVAWSIQRSDDWNRDLNANVYEPNTGDIGRLEPGQDQLYPLSESLHTRNREMIQQVASLYRQRGTRSGIEEYLRIYAGKTNAFIHEFHELMQVGVNSTVGYNTIVGNRPFYFQVEVRITNAGPGVVQEYNRSIRAIVDQEKPAHTHYDLIIKVVGLQIGVHSTIGNDTLLGGTIV